MFDFCELLFLVLKDEHNLFIDVFRKVQNGEFYNQKTDWQSDCLLKAK